MYLFLHFSNIYLFLLTMTCMLTFQNSTHTLKRLIDKVNKLPLEINDVFFQIIIEVQSKVILYLCFSKLLPDGLWIPTTQWRLEDPPVEVHGSPEEPL